MPPLSAQPQGLQALARRLAHTLRQPPPWLRALATCFALGLIAGVLWFGAQPAAVRAMNFGWDKLLHAALHFVLCWLWVVAFGLRRGGWAFLACVGFAVLDEFAQQFSPGRTVSAADVFASAVGALLALSCAHSLAWWGEMRELRRAQARHKRLAFWLRPPGR